MKKSDHFLNFLLVGFILLLLAFINKVESQELSPTSHTIFDGRLNTGYDMGVNTSGGRTDWLSNQGGYMRMAYPPGQSWGAVFITYGKPRNFPRSGKDLSRFEILSVELRGAKGGEVVEIGLKDNEDPDNGSEAKIPVTVTKEWKTYTFPLSKFFTADLKNLYVVTEFVFGYESATVDFRNIKFISGQQQQTSPRTQLNPDSSESIMALQAGLKCMGYNITSIDGSWGPETQAAVKQYAAAQAKKLD